MRRPRSAGLLPYRILAEPQVLLAHPGGPYFAHRDDGWWTVVKGLVKDGETDEDAAGREFVEETGWQVPDALWTPLGETKLKSRKIVVAWAFEADLDPMALAPGHFMIGDSSYPEIDRVDWFTFREARMKLNREQGLFIDRLEDYIDNERERFERKT